MSKPKLSGKRAIPAASVATSRRVSGSPAREASVPPTVPVRWLATAIAIAIAAAFVCAWGALCILLWQGSWQLLYHPVSAVKRTPASVNLRFDSIGFATTASGEPQLCGWWIPATTQARYTAVYLHGADGNLGDTVDALASLHALGLNVFGFDYRGYGQSYFVHPSEARWREDAGSAIKYLTETRHLAPGSLILIGRDLGANLAVETAAAHPDLAGIVLEQPLESPTAAIFNDARARLVPAHLLVSDRWDTNTDASNVLIPSLWFYWTPQQVARSDQNRPDAYQKTPARKMLVWLTNSPDEPKQFNSALTSWLDELPSAAN
jgi:pimeloyl-ACP methyl ester carboxylesterase